MATKTTKSTPAKESTRDVFGSRDGSICHSINAVIIAAKGRPVSIDKIVEKSGHTCASPSAQEVVD